MDPSTAIDYIGELVVCTDQYYGSYVGVLQRRLNVGSGTWRASILILACVEYPSQFAQIWDGVKGRKPFEFGSVENFDLDSVIPFIATIPTEELDESFYKDSVMKALEKAIDIATDHRVYEKLLKHKEEFGRVNCVVGWKLK